MKDFLLETPMSRTDYMRINSKYSLQDIRTLYHIDRLIAEDGYVSIKITKFMYGLKQAFIIAYKQHISYMDPHYYFPVPLKPGLWSH